MSGSLRIPKSSMISSGTVEISVSMNCLRVPSSDGVGEFVEQDVGLAVEHR